MAIAPFSPALVVRARPWRLGDKTEPQIRENSDGEISDKQTDDEPNKFCRCVRLPEQYPRAVVFLLLMQSDRGQHQTLKANVVLRTSPAPGKLLNSSKSSCLANSSVICLSNSLIDTINGRS